jgi:tetratricopeptide (TPR) repeat protein
MANKRDYLRGRSDRSRTEELTESAELGLAYFKEENYLEALRYLEKSLTETSTESGHTPANVTSAYGLCIGIVRKKWPESVRLCRKGLECDYLNVDLHYNLAMAFLGAEMKGDAIRALTSVMEIDPRHRASTYLLGRLGVRKKPVIGILSRSNRLNRVLGKLIHESRPDRRSSRSSAPRSSRKSAAGVP